MRITLSQLKTPVGTIGFALSEAGLCALDFLEPARVSLRARLERTRPGARFVESEAAAPVAARLTAYFAGQLLALEDLPVDPAGTAFQLEVWSALRQIGPGQTSSYRQLAEKIGRPKAVRAVGMANAKNPIALVVPCHRIIASDGTLCGYAYGLERKRWLLQHEGVTAVERAPRPRARAIVHSRLSSLALTAA